MSIDWRNDEEVQLAAHNLFLGVVPERSQELGELWIKYDLRFNVLEELTSDGSFIFDAGQYRDIRFNHRALRAFWLSGFIAWEGYRSIHSFLITETLDFHQFNEMVDVLFDILREDDSAIVSMPKGIPEPGKYAGPAEHKVAAELSTMAIGWAFLHEVRHIRHQREGTSRGDTHLEKHAEELSCDEFATRFLLDRADEYASEHGEDLHLVRSKRELGIYFAMFALTLIKAEAGKWGSSESHPAIQTRIDAMINQIQGNGTRLSDAIAHVAFGALWGRWPDAPGPFK